MVPFLSFSSEVSKRFKAVVSLDETIFSKLVRALGEELHNFSGRTRVHDHALKIAPNSAEEFTFAVEALLPFLLNDQYTELPAEEIIKGVFQGIDRLKKEETNWTLAEKKLLKIRLKRVLSDANIKLRARAWDLVLERPLVLEEARILTDIRPVFTSKSPPSLEACTVIHTLVLNVTEGQDVNTLHIALDTKDLESLKEAIARAEHKEKVLNNLTSKAGVLSLQIQ